MSPSIRPSLFALAFALPLLAAAAPFAIAVSGPLEAADVTTHQIKSGNAILGVSDKGGGYINMLVLPGVGDVMRSVAGRYGRGGQISIRDELHGRRYNPTQAGFSDRAGTHVELVVRGNEIVMPKRPMSLWNGDRAYDFTAWENLAADPFPNDGGNSDSDNLDESALPGKQADEITSEFDFTGSYSSVLDGTRIKIPAFRFRYEVRYARKPGHAIRQFGPSTPAYKPASAVADISVESPPGVHPSTEWTMGQLITSSTIRGDKAVWNPTVIFTVNAQRQLVVGRPGPDQDELPDSAGSLVILATSTNTSAGTAIGFFQPANRVNTYNVVGRSLADDSLKYEDRRVTRTQLVGSLTRTEDMWLIGSRTHSTGLLSQIEAERGIYEAVRGETYILIGTPREILDASVQLSN